MAPGDAARLYHELTSYGPWDGWPPPKEHPLVLQDFEPNDLPTFPSPCKSYPYGLPTVALWQWGPSVVSVTTNGSPALVQRICDELPAQEAYAPSLMDRAATGLGRLVGVR